MAKSMVVVESPAKARTIERYLGKEYVVKACAGHVKDLPKKVLGVDVEGDFKPSYSIIPGKERIVRDLKKIAGKSDAIFLAADPDREGEAICQHLVEELRRSADQPVHRVLFNEITKPAILDAFRQAGSIDQHKVAAQQARRILDRLVGYKVSPLLWKKVRRGLSAGRVQSVALRLIVDREKERQAFVSEEYWNFSARLLAELPPQFVARAVKLDGKKFKVSDTDQAEQLAQQLRDGQFVVADVKKRDKRRRPVAPFVTSTLQQDASRKLNFSVKKTMVVAQRLYEGVQLGDEGRVGLITYMRTDSTRVAGSALTEVREHIASSYGGDYLPAKPVSYQKKKGAQDAHEAVRPTSSHRLPTQLKGVLGRDEQRLYELIWKRFVASQMKPALFDHTEIEIDAARTRFKATGDVLRFDGFLRVYEEAKAASRKDDSGDRDRLLPQVTKGETLSLKKLDYEQKFTQPPPRYSEATLVKALEDRGIGRPSTYAQILTVIQEREYVVKEERKFTPTETGTVVSDLLVENFDDLFNYDYTARLERHLDDIEKGDRDWVDALKVFYTDFSRELTQAQERMKNLKAEEVPAGFDCEKCGSPMVIKWGRFGRFVACGGYPECKNTREIEKEDAPEKGDEDPVECSKCGRNMVKKKGRYGEFLACSGYPECKNTLRVTEGAAGVEVKPDRPLEDKCPKCEKNLVVKNGRYGEFVACSGYPDCKYIRQETTGVTCPDCSKGEIIRRKSRRGKVFYSCNAYPKCKYVLWYKPVPAACPQCDRPFLLERTTKREGVIRVCSDKACSHKEIVQEAEAPVA